MLAWLMNMGFAGGGSTPPAGGDTPDLPVLGVTHPQPPTLGQVWG